MIVGAARNRARGRGWLGLATTLLVLSLVAGIVGNSPTSVPSPSASISVSVSWPESPVAPEGHAPASPDLVGQAPVSDVSPEAPVGPARGSYDPLWTPPPADEANAAVPDDVLVPGQVVLMLREQERLDTFLDELIGGDIGLKDTIPELRAAVLTVPVGQEDQQIAALKTDSRVLFAERNALLSAMMV